MKKLALKLLFSSMILINNYTTDTVITTTMGPINIVVDQNQSTNVNNIVTLGGTINIGDSTTGNITLSSTVFNSVIQALGVGEYLPLGVSSTGVIHAGNVTQLGSLGDNEISCQSVNSATSPDIFITSLTSTGGTKRNIKLNAAGDINFVSQDLIPPVLGSNNVLSIDSNGNLFTSDASALMIFGNSDKNFIKLDNSITNAGIKFDTSYLTNANNSIFLNAGSNNILFNFASSPSANYQLLAIDSSGNLKKMSAGDQITCGSLTAAGSAGESINFGVSNGNTFSLSDSSDTVIHTTGSYGISLKSAGHITLQSSDVTNAPITNTVFALNIDNHLVTTDDNSLFLLGNNSNSLNNYITVDNSSTNPTGVIVNGNFKITGLPGVSALAAGSTAVLTIDSDGKISIVVSDINKKENIEALEIGDDFYDIKPISYTFKGRENSATEFGFSAQALRGTSYEKAIIWGKDGEPVSIDYKSIFVAAIAKFFETRKELFGKVQELESKLNEKDNIISYLQSEITQLKIQSNQLENLIQSFLK